MQFDKILDNRDRLVRLLLAAALALVAVGSFRTDRRLVGVLAGVGAVGLGYTAAVNAGEPREVGVSQLAMETEAADDEGGMHCVVCSEPIAVGQSRRPNADNQIVHEGCL